MLRTKLIALVGLCSIGLPACGQIEGDPAQRIATEADASNVETLTEAARKLAQKEYQASLELAKTVSQRDGIRADQLQRAAEIVFQSGDSETAVALFDRVIEMAPSSMPFNWQRGIALCCKGDFERGAEQFQAHHQVNPDDVENSAWYFLCVAKTKGIEAARETVIPSRGDPRQPMMSILEMYRGKLKPAEVVEAAIESSPPGPARERAKFYADLYIGLYHDSLGQAEQAEYHLKRSLEYGQNGYMFHAARIYLADRLSESGTE